VWATKNPILKARMQTLPEPLRDLVLTFGKYSDKGVAWVAQHDLRYLAWMASLPTVRANPNLWASVRGHLIAALQAELDAERFGSLA